MPINSSDIRDEVKRKYADAAAHLATVAENSTQPTQTSCCSTEPVSVVDEEGRVVFGGELYTTEAAVGAPQAAVAASLGCGVPTAVADLQPGETVLDLGSGAGADVLISARRVEPGGPGNRTRYDRRNA